MVACTFNNVTVHTYRVESMSAKGTYSFECTLKCRTDSSANIASLAALQGHIGTQLMASGKTRIQTLGGTKATLVLNGISYANCYIADLTWQDVPITRAFTRWEYTIKFIQETI